MNCSLQAILLKSFVDVVSLILMTSVQGEEALFAAHIALRSTIIICDLGFYSTVCWTV